MLKALSNAVQTNSKIKGNITSSDLVMLGLLGNQDSAKKRFMVAEKFHLGFGNAKTFLKRVNYSGITLEELKNSL